MAELTPSELEHRRRLSREAQARYRARHPEQMREYERTRAGDKIRTAEDRARATARQKVYRERIKARQGTAFDRAAAGRALDEQRRTQAEAEAAARIRDPAGERAALIPSVKPRVTVTQAGAAQIRPAVTADPLASLWHPARDIDAATVPATRAARQGDGIERMRESDHRRAQAARRAAGLVSTFDPLRGHRGRNDELARLVAEQAADDSGAL